MAEIAKDTYSHRQYSSRKLKECIAALHLCLSYSDSLANIDELREPLDLYTCCSRDDDSLDDKYKFVSQCLLDIVIDLYGINVSKSLVSAYRCAICEGVLVQPVTTVCGHTFCKKCLLKDNSRTCRKCGHKIQNLVLETNIVVKGLVEKFWSGELMADSLREEGNELFHRNELEAALSKYNDAILLAPDSHLVLSNRSRALYKLGRLQGALIDAEHVIRLRPYWGKGHYRRAVALLALGHYEDALLSFCTFVALDKNLQVVRQDVSKTIYYLLTEKRSSSRCHGGNSFGVTTRLRKSRYFTHTLSHCQSPLLNTSDCEDNFSEEEDCKNCSRLQSPAVSKGFSIHAVVDNIFKELEKFKRLEYKPPDTTIEPSLVDKSDFDCVLCCRTLWKPITTPCGHTYCLVCLDRSLDYSSSCALCIKSLSDYLTVTPKNVTEFLEKAIKSLLPTEYSKRQITYREEVSDLLVSSLEQEPRIPVFVCTTAYPYVPCPLFIFEPRYRLMIRRCVEAGTRQFGIAACLSTETGARRYADFGTMLEIKDRVLMSDGCSILTTVGVKRFKTLSRSERDGYDTARVEFIQDEPISESELPAVKELHDRVRKNATAWVKTFTADFQEQIISSFGALPDVEDQWMFLPDGPAWTWWLLAILPLGPQLQVGILGTTSLEKRLRAIDKTLNHIQDRLKSGESPRPSLRTRSHLHQRPQVTMPSILRSRSQNTEERQNRHDS